MGMKKFVCLLLVVQLFLCVGAKTTVTLPLLNWVGEEVPFVAQYYSALYLGLLDVNNDPNLLADIELELENSIHSGSTARAISLMIEYDERNETFVIGNPLTSTSEFTGIAGSVYGIAQLSGTATSPQLSDKRIYPYYSRVSESSNGQAIAVQEAISYYSQFGLGWTEVAIICTSETYGVNLATYFVQQTENDKNSKITISTFQQFLPDQEDLSVEINEIVKSGARVIIAFIFGRWETLITTAAESGLVSPNHVWFVPNVIVGLSSETASANVQQLTQGTLGTNVFLPETGKIEEFLERWYALDPVEYPGTDIDPSSFALQVYDMVYAAAYAVETVNSQGLLNEPRISPEVWTDAVRGISFEGVTGTVELDANGDRVSQYSMMFFSEGKWIRSAVSSPGSEYVVSTDVVWYDNTTNIPDLDIRPSFHYWSCHDGKEKFDATGKTVTIHSPGSSDVDNIESHYHCDRFIDCHNLSDESVECGSNYLALFIAFGIITGILILLVIFLCFFTIIFGICLHYKRVRAASPVFLMITLISVFVGYSSVFAWYGKPHPVSCAFQPWLLGLSTVSLVSALVVKNFRIWRIFRFPLKRTKITNHELLFLYVLVMLPAVFILTLWTIISTPTASLEERDEELHFVCNTGGFTGEPGGIVFFSIFLGYSVLLLLFGMFVSIATRKVPTMFNETKLVAISIYNLAFLGVVVIPVFLIVQPYNPFLAWIIRTLAILYAFTATLFIQFVPMIIGVTIIDRCRNKTPTQSFSKSTGINDFE